MFRLDLNKIQKINWYRQGGAVKLFYGFIPYHCIHETIGYDRIVIVQEGERNIGFFDKKFESGYSS